MMGFARIRLLAAMVAVGCLGLWACDRGAEPGAGKAEMELVKVRDPLPPGAPVSIPDPPPRAEPEPEPVVEDEWPVEADLDFPDHDDELDLFEEPAGDFGVEASADPAPQDRDAEPFEDLEPDQADEDPAADADEAPADNDDDDADADDDADQALELDAPEQAGRGERAERLLHLLQCFSNSTLESLALPVALPVA